MTKSLAVAGTSGAPAVERLVIRSTLHCAIPWVAAALYRCAMSIGALYTKLESSLENLVTLEIVTAVGPVQPTTRDSNGVKIQATTDAGAKLLRTSIDLLQGDITTEMDPAFVTGPYQDLRQFHQAREAQAMEIVKGNIEAVKALVALIQGRERGEPGGPT
jgi:hypothetical protein